MDAAFATCVPPDSRMWRTCTGALLPALLAAIIAVPQYDPDPALLEQREVTA